MLNTTKGKRIYLSTPHMSGKEMKYIQDAFDSNWIAPLGFNVDEFEKGIANYIGAKGAVAVSSGTAAIHLALSLLDVNRGDTVFCSTLTFVASANPILYQGAEPVFIDSEPNSWNMCPNALKRAFEDAAMNGKLPKAVIIVNLYGQSAKMDELLSICKAYQVPIIEDAAESLGTIYRGKFSGTFGDYGIFSFNGNKIITTSGGGMLVSDNAEVIDKARFLATQARDPAIYYLHSRLGYNYRLSNVLAGIGRGQLEVLDERIKVKREIFETYKRELEGYSCLSFMKELENSFSNRWLTVLTIDDKKAGITVGEIVDAFAENDIEARPVWKPLHTQPLFKNSKYYPHNNEKSISEKLFLTGICLPSGTNMTKEEQIKVINCLKNLLIHSK
ncbi:pyridoxal phosphate-dependent aminotransferase [Heyndrickxia shackletonii]|uniref:Pyridoxal phosphate-dependent aminotransferase n=1 Tax=Heyndrickxia shackletonii TaxID=157838 RepID=A0A0Q3TJC1_9BACI|nr:aminotransferase class I/II-fold pyridoxal phosphate-dependent enzyme [Heyndrickxia shackletonii]KQL54046.1 pyridoxal phosphate-dependent aminotransferase [Heyndrickxia shackletonii]MBB2478781.1 aminotransferase class I/II-fold pyridoxal phosphate-dependent enzyme [Bacillus sp. APMAM]NEZ02201.1 aminotransferase class I/II-fold pyridoxal phosphate-dependent enzyme [Heyndrickxia shackletonii]RTZ57533.1 aminotransferase class I/II-fold pyridoxal phosphate-dependent enzyme [Bacillus sp. SAJ1]